VLGAFSVFESAPSGVSVLLKLVETLNAAQAKQCLGCEIVFP
jgi:hypothetical protein